MKRLVGSVLLLAFVLAACTTAPAPRPTAAPATRTLTVFAAASLTGAFKEIGKAFEASHPGVSVTFNFAGSQTLRAQIEQGAQPDVFASASTKEVNTLVAEGDVAQSVAQAFATNRLVVIVPARNPAGLQVLEDLARPGTKLVLAAQDVPVGSYARHALDLMDAKFGNSYKSRVLANVVSNEEDVKQVVAKIQLGEADAAIVYTSDAVAAPELKSIDIPAALNITADYPIAALSKSSNADLAADFIAFVLSPDGQAVLKKWGFTPVH